MTPEHLHLAINHIPVIGLALAGITILVGIVSKTKASLSLGLVMAAICGWSTPVVMNSGERAFERYKEGGEIHSHMDADADTYLQAHHDRAETWAKTMYGTAILATLALLLIFWRWEYAGWLSAIVVLACFLSTAAGVWIAESGGKIRRVDFRDSTSEPVDSPEEEGEEGD